MTHGTGGSDSIRAARFLMRMGRSFPIKAQPESAFHFGAGFRDAVSGCMAIGKLHPVSVRHSGMHFPLQ